MKRIRFVAEVDVTDFAYEKFKNVIDAYRFDEGIDYNKLRPIDIINEEVICNDDVKNEQYEIQSPEKEKSELSIYTHSLKFKEFLSNDKNHDLKDIAIYGNNRDKYDYLVTKGKVFLHNYIL